MSSSATYLYDANGRQGIGVAQPRSGIDFPLVNPSADIEYLLADLQLVFDTPAAAYELPLRVSWLSGFGTAPAEVEPPTYDSSASSWSSVCSSSASQTCLPLPKHDYDIQIADTAGRLVFDSTLPGTTVSVREWGSRLLIVTWAAVSGESCSVVVHTHWGFGTEPQPREYSTYFFPEVAVIDERCLEQRPTTLRSITVGTTRVAAGAVEFYNGYNMELAAGKSIVTDGTRQTTAVDFDASPGGGLGVFPGCLEPSVLLRRVNGVAADTYGNLTINAGGCYFVRQPTRIVSTSPRRAMPQILLAPGNVVDVGLPDPLAGTTTAAAGWPTDDDPQYAHLQIGNDCGPCCDCTDYVDVATRLNTVGTTYSDVGVKLANTRTLYHANRDRWLDAATCLLKHPLRVLLVPQFCPFMDVAIQYCNQSAVCQTDIELTATVTTIPAGGRGRVVPGYTFMSGIRKSGGRTENTVERGVISEDWPVFRVFFDLVQPRSSVFARFRLTFDDCGIATGVSSSSSSSSSSAGVAPSGVPYAVRVCVNGTVSGDVITVPSDADPNVRVPAEQCETRTLNCPNPSYGQPVDLTGCYCVS